MKRKPLIEKKGIPVCKCGGDHQWSQKEKRNFCSKDLAKYKTIYGIEYKLE